MVRRDEIRRAYDGIAEAYAAQRSGDGRGVEVLARFLDSLSHPERVLDAGCGGGRPVLPRIGAAAAAVGLDLSREQLRLAWEAVPDASLLQGDMAALPFEEGVFDAVVAYWSLIHVPLDDHRTVADEFAHVLRPGGRALVCEGTERWTGENPDWLDTGVGMQWAIAGEDATRDHLRDAGFTVLDGYGVPETLGDGSAADDDAWTFLDARLDG